MLDEDDVTTGFPPGTGGGIREIKLEGSLVIEPTFVKLEKEVDAEVVLALLFFREGSCGGGTGRVEDEEGLGEMAIAGLLGVARSEFEGIVIAEGLSFIAAFMADSIPVGEDGSLTGGQGLLCDRELGREVAV